MHNRAAALLLAAGQGGMDHAHGGFGSVEAHSLALGAAPAPPGVSAQGTPRGQANKWPCTAVGGLARQHSHQTAMAAAAVEGRMVRASHRHTHTQEWRHSLMQGRPPATQMAGDAAGDAKLTLKEQQTGRPGCRHYDSAVASLTGAGSSRSPRPRMTNGLVKPGRRQSLLLYLPLTALLWALTRAMTLGSAQPPL
jgi:hypothetical protein